MALFGKKEDRPQQPQAPMPPLPAQGTSVPTEDVTRLRQQGLSNSQIVETLQRAGYKTHQIFDAMNQAELGRSAEQIPGAPYFNEQPAPMESAGDYQQEEGVDERIEEIAEAIIEEKWNELLKDVNKIIEWKSTMEANMKALEQRQQDLKQSFDGLQKALLSKVNEYDQNITNVGSELKALEKVFQKILPTFTENVNELSRAVKDLKKK